MSSAAWLSPCTKGKSIDVYKRQEVLSRVTNDMDTLSQTLNQSITQIITSVTMVVGIIAMMFSISWQLTLVALCVIPVSLVFILIIVKHSQKYFAAQQEYLGHVNGHVEEMYGGHTVMKAFNGEEASMQQFDPVSYTHLDVYKRQAKILVISIGAQSLRTLMQQMSIFDLNDKAIVLCMKGIEATTGKRLTQVVNEYVPKTATVSIWVGPGHRCV